jgi:CRISPR/Cas system-associated protein Cas10 (large subunit of type III CRISPR-Cas system)
MPATIPSQSRELLNAIKEKQDRMSEDVTDIKRAVRDMDECQQEFRITYTAQHADVVNSANLAHKRLDEFLIWKIETEKQIKAITTFVERQAVMNSILIFVSTVLGGAVLTYIWQLITGG